MYVTKYDFSVHFFNHLKCKDYFYHAGYIKQVIDWIWFIGNSLSTIDVELTHNHKIEEIVLWDTKSVDTLSMNSINTNLEIL